MVKFMKYSVKDTETGVKARVMYSVDGRCDGLPCVTLYAKDYSEALGDVLPDVYENNSDGMSDYFEKGRATLFVDHPLYEEARKVAEEMDPWFRKR